jgi:hypothetical protein
MTWYRHLPANSNEALAPIGRMIDTGMLYYRVSSDIPRGVGQHLYLTSNQQVKVGDWVVDGDVLYCASLHDADTVREKVLATTDLDRILVDSDRIFNSGIQKIPDYVINSYVNVYNEKRRRTLYMDILDTYVKTLT